MLACAYLSESSRAVSAYSARQREAPSTRITVAGKGTGGCAPALCAIMLPRVTSPHVRFHAMQINMIARAAALTMLAVFAAPSLGAQAVPTVQQAEARKDKPKLFTADLGFVKTSGNTDLTTLNVNEKIAFERMGWGARAVLRQHLWQGRR